MPKTSFNSSDPLILFSLVFYPKNAAESLLNPFLGVKYTERLCDSVMHSKSLSIFAMLDLTVMKLNLPLFTKIIHKKIYSAHTAPNISCYSQQ